MGSLFTPAATVQSKARIALCGASGSGKTYSALAIAEGLGGRVAVIDTERGSAAKYARRFSFDHLDMAALWAAEAEHEARVRQEGPYAIRRYILYIQAAGAEGYDVLVIDSLSHAWAGEGGALSMIDRANERGETNRFAAWRNVTPLHNRLIDTMLGSSCHIIATMRSKQEYALEQSGGRTSVRKLGMAPIQRDGMDYEFDVVGDLDQEHRLVVSKARCPDVDGMAVECPGRAFGEIIRAWCADGVPQVAAPEATAPDGTSLAKRLKALASSSVQGLAHTAFVAFSEAEGSKDPRKWSASARQKADEQLAKLEAVAKPVEAATEECQLAADLHTRYHEMEDGPAGPSLKAAWASIARREGNQDPARWSNIGLDEAIAAIDAAEEAQSEALAEAATEGAGEVPADE